MYCRLTWKVGRSSSFSSPCCCWRFNLVLLTMKHDAFFLFLKLFFSYLKMWSVRPQTLTNNTLHDLKLLAQVRGELLLAVVELDVLRGSFPQPAHTVRSIDSDASAERNELTHSETDVFSCTRNWAPLASSCSCPASWVPWLFVEWASPCSPRCCGCKTTPSTWWGTGSPLHPCRGQSLRLGRRSPPQRTQWWMHQWLKSWMDACLWFSLCQTIQKVSFSLFKKRANVTLTHLLFCRFWFPSPSQWSRCHRPAAPRTPPPSFRSGRPSPFQSHVGPLCNCNKDAKWKVIFSKFKTSPLWSRGFPSILHDKLSAKVSRSLATLPKPQHF